MGNDNLPVTPIVDPVIDETEVSSTADTQPKVQNSPAVDSGHEVKEESTKSAEIQPTVDDKEEEKVRREEGKLKQVQKELEEERKKREDAEERNTKLTSFAAKNEKRYRNALIETSGYTPEDADKIITDLKAKTPDLWANQEKPKITEEARIAEVVSRLPEVQYTRNLLQQQQEAANKKAAEFEKDRTDIAEGRSLDEANAIRGQIGATAGFYVKTKGIDHDKALEMAYDAILHPERLAEQGRLEGYLQAVNKQSAIGTNISGQETKKSGADLSSLTEIERQVYDQGGFKDPEEYLKWKNS